MDGPTYADVIVDISGEKLDHTFQYRIPEQFVGLVRVGTVVQVPFGKGTRQIRAYVTGLSQTPAIDPAGIRDIAAAEPELGADGNLIALAGWMKQTYGSTMAQALRTVMPLKRKAAHKKKRRIVLKTGTEQAAGLLEEYERKHQSARTRLMRALLAQPERDYGSTIRELKLTASTLRPLEQAGVISVEEETLFRFPELPEYGVWEEPPLTAEQRRAVDGILEEARNGSRPALLHGITGSGKTRVYLELIRRMITEGKQVIVLIPEIALTYQIIWQFRQAFGEKAALIHSKMSQGERWDAFAAAREGRVSVMVGPRSALFTPFTRLGMIVIDEEHEPSYQSEGTPHYHARETAAERCRLEGAQLVLGSATPSMQAYEQCRSGKWRLETLGRRFGSGGLPEVRTVDMREELRMGNTTVLSRSLTAEIGKRLERREQTILFLNRRGYAGFVSCRSCGYVVKCPHCDVSLTQHRNGLLTCHYCGYSVRETSGCPVCGSRHIGGFRAGTEQVEEIVRKNFPQATVLRMDADTTRTKDSYSRILSAFAGGEADILIGTQMIIKGHDFPHVTLVGILAADLSLFAGDYRASERTFQLLVQAAGRAGRGRDPGVALIQTYHPEHYSIQAALTQDYEVFFEAEMRYRRLLDYPPAGGMLAVVGSGEDETLLGTAMWYIRNYIEKTRGDEMLTVIGPADAAVSRIQDRWRKVLYVKHRDKDRLSFWIRSIERYIEINSGFKTLSIQMERS